MKIDITLVDETEVLFALGDMGYGQFAVVVIGYDQCNPDNTSFGKGSIVMRGVNCAISFSGNGGSLKNYDLHSQNSCDWLTDNSTWWNMKNLRKLRPGERVVFEGES